MRNRTALVAELAAAIARRPVATWLEAMHAAGVPGGPVRTIPEVFEHAPFATVTHEHPLLGPMRTVRSPIALDGEHATAASAPPLLGQHTPEVLEELGYDAAERERLLAGPCRT